jgi:UDP-N-acetylglucosamine 1-carboxyvinyltransferase
MHTFEVAGGKKLSGDIIPQGAKNEALQIISAAMLTPEKVTITNIPDILDVNLLIELLAEMKVKIDRPERDTCVFQADDVDIDYLHSETFRRKKRAAPRFCHACRAYVSAIPESFYSKTWRR